MSALGSSLETVMKYFDPRSVLFAKHAQHIVLVHFPIALLVTSVAFDLLGRWTGRRALESAAALNLYAAALAAPVTMGTGLIAWRWQLEGAPLKGALLLHLCGAMVTVFCCWGLAWYRLRRPDEELVPLPAAYHAAGLVTCLVTAVTAHLGGIVSGVVTAGG
jgi:uncharacterized membrane protein